MQVCSKCGKEVKKRREEERRREREGGPKEKEWGKRGEEEKENIILGIGREKKEKFEWDQGKEDGENIRSELEEFVDMGDKENEGEEEIKNKGFLGV